ncbi:thioredoxin [candidate division WOR-3 bacterium JGI_Cruoil_03_44_89]|uniref:Thioredoxin n=1 Tax=candidate division WOR-3 bacterium JGI_Cruoil_03_44_89 TaxID=1973748 RepID=A0A235BSS4_UNCW3|nr:MAG: thioredoxin [candidate division WOR-3 bacterium JGI_Cruoil_03_44_89]
MAEENVKPLNDFSFGQEVLESDIPVIVDFWAPWCMPCRIVSPIVEELTNKYEGRVKFCKLNVDADGPNTARQYRITGIPTLLIFKNGRIADQIIGAAPKENIAARLDKVLGVSQT